MDVIHFLRGPLIIVAAALFVAYYTFNAIDEALKIPAVHTSNSTGECVRVVEADGTIRNCDPLPARYSRVWVK